MNHDPRRAELADFLRSRRLALQPEEVGLPPRASRRTPGLRREDVADLAGISSCWYSQLEQARKIRVSDHVLSSLAGALRLNGEEYDYLLTLTSEDVRSRSSTPANGVPPTLQRILDSQLPHPALAIGPRFDILAWNQARSDVYGDLSTTNPGHRHLLRILFSDHMRELMQNWEPSARSALAEFRSATGPYVDEPWFTELVRELSEMSEEFRAWWQRHEIGRRRIATREIRHPLVGPLLLEETTLVVDDRSSRRVILETPQPGTGTEDRLTALAWRHDRVRAASHHALGQAWN